MSILSFGLGDLAKAAEKAPDPEKETLREAAKMSDGSGGELVNDSQTLQWHWTGANPRKVLRLM